MAETTININTHIYIAARAWRDYWVSIVVLHTLSISLHYLPIWDNKYTQCIQIEARSIIEQWIISRRGCSLGLLIRSIMSNAALVPISGVGKAMVVSGG